MLQALQLVFKELRRDIAHILVSERFTGGCAVHRVMLVPSSFVDGCVLCASSPLKERGKAVVAHEHTSRAFIDH